MDELDETVAPTTGERLRAAREEKGLSLEEVASQTRIPRRHLESLELADWERLPAPTYTIGFAKSYASAVGLDRNEIGEQLRSEIGGAGATTTQAEVFEPADPARTMPRSLVLAAIVAVIIVVLVMTWLSNRSLDQGSESSAQTASAPATEAPAQPQSPAASNAAPQPVATGPVVLTATAPAWFRVTDQGKKLFEGMLQPGQTYQVPQTATAPLLRVGAPEALRINVGSAVAPQVGPPGQVTSNVSLKPADLMKSGQPAEAAAAPNTSR
jgi:cytoskeleton protein RodZ